MIAELIRTGSRVALADGAGVPTMVLDALCQAARTAGGVRLLLGWCPGPLDTLDTSAFAEVRTTMAGYGLRRAVDRGDIGFIPIRLGAVPTFVRHVFVPDVLVASVAPSDGGFRFTTEVAWQPAAVAAGATVAAVVRTSAPACDAGPVLPPDRVVVVADSDTPPHAVEWGNPGDDHRAVGDRVAAVVPEGACVQFGPGPVGTAVLDALTRPVRVDSGLLTEAVMDLDRRGLLLDDPSGAYLAGSPELYGWASDRKPGFLHPVDHTHDPGRLARLPLYAVNTALEVDLDGQVNTEAAGGSTIAGIGGHPDFSFAATNAPTGLSILAVPTERNGHPTLVEGLSAPVTTGGHDVEMVVTENGCADLRGLTRAERRRAIARLWEH